MYVSYFFFVDKVPEWNIYMQINVFTCIYTSLFLILIGLSFNQNMYICMHCSGHKQYLSIQRQNVNLNGEILNVLQYHLTNSMNLWS